VNKQESSRVEDKLNSALNEETITELGFSTGFTERLRVMTPYRVALSLIGALATQTVETLADLERKFVAMTGCSISSKPFHNQLSKPAFAEFMREVLCHLSGQLVVQVLEPVPGSRLELFDDIELQDGSSFAIVDSLAARYPGRFTKTSPAAIELHATMSLFQDRMVRISLAPDSQGERVFLARAGLVASQADFGRSRLRRPELLRACRRCWRPFRHPLQGQHQADGGKLYLGRRPGSPVRKSAIEEDSQQTPWGER